jgi:hypothetical protein
MALRKATLDAAAGGMGEDPMSPAMPSEEDEYSPDAEHKAAFLDMCRAIREGDDEAAWAAYQECKELDGGGSMPDLEGEMPPMEGI